MSDPGGSSTINGVFSQLLGSLSHVIVRLRTNEASAADPSITLTLEPRRGGGDTQVNKSTGMVVEPRATRGPYYGEVESAHT